MKYAGARMATTERYKGGVSFTAMADETPPDTDQAPDEGGGEPGRDDVAGQRGGQPGYDLDEGEAYEAAEGEDGPSQP